MYCMFYLVKHSRYDLTNMYIDVESCRQVEHVWRRLSESRPEKELQLIEGPRKRKYKTKDSVTAQSP